MRLLVLLAVLLMAVSLPTNPAFHPAFLPLPANQPTAPGAQRSCRTTRNFRMILFGPAPDRLVSTPGLSTSPHVPAAGKESLAMVSTAQQNSGTGARFLPGAGRLPVATFPDSRGGASAGPSTDRCVGRAVAPRGGEGIA